MVYTADSNICQQGLKLDTIPEILMTDEHNNRKRDSSWNDQDFEIDVTNILPDVQPQFRAEQLHPGQQGSQFIDQIQTIFPLQNSTSVTTSPGTQPALPVSPQMELPKTPINHNQSISGYPPSVPYPFVPFWSGCPLPFSPMAYPQIVLPPQPTISTNTKEGKIAKYRLKRGKRNFNRPVDQQRSLLAQSRTRDERGKFEVSAARLEVNSAIASLQVDQLGKKVEKSLRDQVDELKLRLAASESESQLLRQKLLNIEKELQQLKVQTRANNQNDQPPSEQYLRTTSSLT